MIMNCSARVTSQSRVFRSVIIRSFVRSMLKIKEATSSRSGDYVNEFGRDVYTTDEIILLGRICNIKIVAQNEMFKIFQEEKKP